MDKNTRILLFGFVILLVSGISFSLFDFGITGKPTENTRLSEQENFEDEGYSYFKYYPERDQGENADRSIEGPLEFNKGEFFPAKNIEIDIIKVKGKIRNFIEDLKRKITISREDVKPEPKIYLPEQITLRPDQNIEFTVYSKKDIPVKDLKLYLQKENNEKLELNTYFSDDLSGATEVLWDVVSQYKNLKFGKNQLFLELTNKEGKKTETGIPIDLKEDEQRKKDSKNEDENVNDENTKTEEREKPLAPVEEKPPEEDDAPPPPPDEDLSIKCIPRQMYVILSGTADSDLEIKNDYASPSPSAIGGVQMRLGKSEGPAIPPREGFYYVGDNFEIKTFVGISDKVDKCLEGQFIKSTRTTTYEDGSEEVEHMHKKNRKYFKDGTAGYEKSKDWGFDDFTKPEKTISWEGRKDFSAGARWKKQHNIPIIQWVDSKGVFLKNPPVKKVKIDSIIIPIVESSDRKKRVQCPFEQHIEVEVDKIEMVGTGKSAYRKVNWKVNRNEVRPSNKYPDIGECLAVYDNNEGAKNRFEPYEELFPKK